MLLMISISLIIMMLTMLLMLISMTISKKMTINREKNSPFECGFDPKSSARLPFSLRFFLIAIIFLIFDVEIALILPTILIKFYSDPFFLMMTLSFFMFILLLGLFHEWNQGALDWID
uniref:NADH-ubiquinone oxidoreductase chain 3 n=1 Tax=Oecanthus sinensis TaxID=1982312 RepID=A0A1W6S5T8_9ORTH|nr:NADH dehydrogenase subunit 3 [Oecanthus sinensis]ARO75192.1 NADH dehydrogenase subunit 3 [Oecanthus sinensis]